MEIVITTAVIMDISHTVMIVERVIANVDATPILNVTLTTVGTEKPRTVIVEGVTVELREP